MRTRQKGTSKQSNLMDSHFNATSPSDRSAVKVLVADDETHIQNVVALKLRRAGYDVIVAGDGRAAVDLARQHRPALIVTDYHMPHLNGLEVCRTLRMDPNWATPAVLLTAQDCDLDPAAIASGGVVEVICKPFSPRALVAAVERHQLRAA